MRPVIAALLLSAPLLDATVSQEGPLPREDQLVLKAEVLSRKYCRGDKELDRLLLRLRLSFMNISQEPFILYRGAYIVHVRVSHTQGDLEAKRYESDSSETVLTSNDDKEITDVMPNESFMILQPGAIFEKEEDASVWVAHGKTGEQAGITLPVGRHVLQVRLRLGPA